MFQVQVYQSHLVLLKLASDEQFLLQPLHIQSFKCTYNTNAYLYQYTVCLVLGDYALFFIYVICTTGFTRFTAI